ncbi:MAG: hypothetical protein M1524_03070 [Patescibacteria group bacterium]|nr:hypothetical protein [Patescibacteria group bacterium]
MQPQTDGDHKKLLSEVIKKQIVILGPDITLAKARNVKELTIADDGTVTAISGNSQEATQKLIEQFMDLSGLIVKKTMEPLLASFPSLVAEQMNTQTPVATPQPSTPSTPQSVQNPNPTMPSPSIPETTTQPLPTPTPPLQPAENTEVPKPVQPTG